MAVINVYIDWAEPSHVLVVQGRCLAMVKHGQEPHYWPPHRPALEEE